MKKIFTLFAAALVGFCAYAQMPETCPSELGLQVLSGDPAQVEVELTLVNSSLNLNGFNVEIEKDNDNVSWKRVSRKYFVAAGYANVILARLEDSTDEEREEILLEYCDVNHNVKDNGHLVIIELLKTNECRFFPVLETPTAIGKFYMDWSAVVPASKDNTVLLPPVECKLYAPTEPERYSFSYTGGVEGTRAWTPDKALEIELEMVKISADPATYEVRKKIPSAISTINTDKAVDNRIFDLQGRELQSVPEHGIYIQNGKKYVK